MVAHKHVNRSILATAAETTPCVPPTWGAEGTNFEHLGVDISGVAQAFLVDPTMESRAKAQGKRARIAGIRNVDWSFRTKLHGLGLETTENSQAAATYLSNLLEWGFGSQTRTYTRAVVSSANAYTLTVGEGLTTGFAAGACVAVEDATSPAAQYNGKPVLRQIASVDAENDTIVLTEALPWGASAAGDIIHATITIAIDETYLEDAIRSGSVRTRSFYHRRANGADTDHIWELLGTVASVGFANLGRGQLPEVVFNCLSANFKHSAGDGLSAASFASIEGKPQLSNGLDLMCSIADASGTTSNLVDVREVSIEPGITRTREETTTELTDLFEGMSTYSATFGDVKFNATLAGYSPAWYAALAAGTEKRIHFWQPGPGTGAGKGWGFILPRASLIATGLAVGSQTFGAQLEFQGMIPSLADTELGTSPLVIALF